MSRLFEQTEINGMELRNRFVRSATWEGMATEDGAVTPKLVDILVRLARGGVGLIITGHAYIRPEGQAGPWQLGIYTDDLIDGLREMTGAVHDSGGRIVAQLAHAGAFADEGLTGQLPLAVSDVDGITDSPRREITREDIESLVDAFAAAARRAKAAGFDGAQIHSAHGYLLSQFLSPRFNHRKDGYGGDIRSRARVHLEIVRAARKAVGSDYPLLIKMNCQDFAEDGLSVEDAVGAGQMLAEAGIDAIELSGGLLTSRKLSPSRPGIRSPEKEAYFREDARRFKREIDLPLILVGGNRSFEVAERLLEEGTADYISMCRPLIREPDLIRRWEAGDRRPAACRSDNLCFGPGRKGEGIYCVTEQRESKK
jgi:2,4-dienoyl-CoA reductase-like NADH-dependent reductase (Old Yellow Enzyme family)